MEEIKVAESETDAKVFNVPLPSRVKPTDVEHLIKNDPSSIYYDMSRKGYAIIFNHYEYMKDTPNVTIPKREGTYFDTYRLRNCLRKLNFDVKICNDYTKQLIEIEMELVRQKERSEIGCLIVVVMTHGDPGRLRAKDADYDIDLLWNGLTASACPHLAGIPKLYFIQACRGDKLDRGFTMTDSSLEVTDSMPSKKKLKIPSMADFLHMYSTYEEYSSWREADGSWFIQSLCEILEEEAAYWDLLQLLTFVNNKVAFEYQSFTHDVETNAMKQIPQIKSMLTKLLKFQMAKETAM